MITSLAIAVLVILATTALFEAALLIRFVRLLQRRPQPPPADDALPRVAVLLPMRGADPSLPDALRRLLAQDYPQYSLHIAIDAVDDPAWEVVERIVAESKATNVSVTPLVERRMTCALKCSALVQLWNEVGDHCDVIVLADGDLMAHPRLLRDLVAPLSDSQVGASFGNRWFMPQEGRYGAIVRALWNVAAVLPMEFFGIPWGGCLAIKSTAMREADIAGKWSRAIVDDTPLVKAFAPLGLRIRFVPQLMIPILEECDLGFSLQFISRQLGWTRIYDVQVWWAIAIFSLFVLALPLAIVGICLAAMAHGLTIGAWLAGSAAAYVAWVLAFVNILDVAVRRTLVVRGEQLPSLPWKVVRRLPLSVFLAITVNAVAVARAMFLRTVVWRGVTYEIRGPWDVRLVEYRPYEPQPALSDSNLSI